MHLGTSLKDHFPRQPSSNTYYNVKLASHTTTPTLVLLYNSLRLGTSHSSYTYHYIRHNVNMFLNIRHKVTLIHLHHIITQSYIFI